MVQKIIELLKENVDELSIVDINEDTLLITSGYMESFDVINMLTVFEQEFEIELSLDNLRLEDFDTVKQIADVISAAKKES